jgi:hypothetical protein
MSIFLIHNYSYRVDLFIENKRYLMYFNNINDFIIFHSEILQYFELKHISSRRKNVKDLIAKCGCNCTTCPTYKDNLKDIDDRKKCSEGWEKYLNIKLGPEKLRLCDGCSIPDDKRKIFYLNCVVRKCAMKNGIENCAYCSAFPCEEVENIHEIQKPDTVQKIINKLGKPIEKKEYLDFIEPYEGVKHLNEIRKDLSSNEIIEFKKFSITPKTFPFPSKEPIKDRETVKYKQIHTILSNIEVFEDIPYARFLKLQKSRDNILKLLWAFGSIGDLNNDFLLLQGKDYLEQKINGFYFKALNIFKILEKHNVICEIVPTQEKGWLTPTGGLRKEGWFMKMSFSDSIGGVSLLKCFKDYVTILNHKYKNNAFRCFSKADMNILYK